MSENIPPSPPPDPLPRPDDVASLLRRAQASIASGAVGTACELLQLAVELDSESLSLRTLLADCLGDLYRFAEAIEVLESALDIARRRNDLAGNTACGNRLVTLLLRTGRKGDARALLQRVIRAELDGRGALSAITLATLSQATRGQWSVARRLKLLHGALSIAAMEERVEVQRQIGRVLLEAGDEDGALRAIEDARQFAERIGMPPSRLAVLLSDQGLALVKTGRYAAAVGALRRAVWLHLQIGNRKWARRLARLARRVLNAQQRLDEIAERN